MLRAGIVALTPQRSRWGYQVAILVTGAAGFIGHHVAKTLLARGERVLGIDSLNSYYDVGLKQARLELQWNRNGAPPMPVAPATAAQQQE